VTAAVRHFAEHGYSGTSIREILRDAGANVAAAHYYFGTKDELYREVVSRFLDRLCEERASTLRVIENAPASTSRQRLEALIRGYVEPHLRLCAEPEARHYIQLMARFVTENEEITGRIYSEILEPTRGRYLKAIAATVPGIPPAELGRLFSFMISLMVTAPADVSYRSLTGRSPWPRSPQHLADQIVAFVTAGMLEAQRAAVARK
jgi:AcrR family transcriptional regulator